MWGVSANSKRQSLWSDQRVGAGQVGVRPRRRHALREFGIRIALGARSREVFRLILRDAACIVAWGAPLGLLGALLLSRLLARFLFGVSAHDPATFLTVSGGMLALVLAASCVPGIRAMRANPADTLRDP